MSIYTDAMREKGKADALDLRARAKDLDGTAIIAEGSKVPDFDPKKDYSTWAVCSPVADEGQIWTLIQPHNASHYDGRPSTLRALWGLCHTKDPLKAKPWVDPYGTSGMYMKDECYRGSDGTVYRSIADNNVYKYEDYPQNWEIVE